MLGKWSGALIIFYMFMVWNGMVFLCYGMLFLFFAMTYLKNDMVCYAIEWYAMLCYEIWVNVPSFTEEIHLFCIF